MTPEEYMEAARVPLALKPMNLGLWEIQRREAPNIPALLDIGWSAYTLLVRFTLATLHGDGEVVMEDSAPELRKHLPIWMHAHGRVLVTGLGLGCVVRGLLANPDVEHIDVVEIDRQILHVVGAEFIHNPRVSLHLGDALTFQWPDGTRWNYGWHDLWTEQGTSELHIMHAKLLHDYRRRCTWQGAWAFPRLFGRIWPRPLLGMKRRAA